MQAPQATPAPGAGWKKRTILFLVSQSVTLFGSTLVQMAIVWYVTMETASGAWVSAFSVCSYLPQFLMSFVGGVWADRFERKRLIILADACIAAVTLALMLLMPAIPAGEPLLYVVLAVSALRSVAAGVQTPAVNAVLPQLVPAEHIMRFNGINATMQSVVQFAAPAAAGAVLTFATLREALAIDIVTAALGIGLLACVCIPRVKVEKSENSLLADMAVGVKYVFSDKFLSRLLITYGLFVFLCVPAGFLATLLVTRVYGESYGYMTAVELVGFAGMAAGGVMMSAWGGFKSRVKTLLCGLAAFGALAIGMGASTNFILYLALMLLYGVALTMVQTATTTLIQERSQPAMQGRVFGLLGSAYSGFLPVGMAVFGPLADAVPLQMVMIASGVALLAMAALGRADKRFYS